MDFAQALVHIFDSGGDVGNRGTQGSMLADGDHGRFDTGRSNRTDHTEPKEWRVARSEPNLCVQNSPVAHQRMKRALLVASAGGHWIELCRLEAAFRQWDCQFVSTAGNMAAPLGSRPVLQIKDSSRDNYITMLRSMTQLLRVIRDFRPDLVVSTGAAPGAIALLIGKAIGARTIWIDSIANSEELSLSGRAVRWVADLRLTQWPDLADDRNGISYFGQVL